MDSKVLTLEEMIDAAGPVVLRVLRRRFGGVSLAPSDDRRENERARDSYQQAMLELCAKFARVVEGADPPIVNLADYSARVAHNTANETLRPLNWTRIANRVKRVISTEPGFAIWEDPEHGRVAGYAGWQSQKRPTGSAANARRLAGTLRSSAVLGTHWENLDGAGWTSVLEQVFDAAGGPLRVNTLIKFLTELLGFGAEIPWEDDAGDDEGRTSLDRLVESPAPNQEERVAIGYQLRDLWTCAQLLRREWRLAFLLNPPSAGAPVRDGRASGRGTSRGELDVFPEYGIASIEEIGQALELTGADLAVLGREDFAALWSHLPLPDNLIGRLVGKTGMQILALRKLALRQLAACMAGRAGGAGHKEATQPSVQGRNR